MIKLGNEEVKSLYIGSMLVERVYLGTTQVYNRSAVRA